MKKKSVIKIGLDIVMAVLLIIMYNKMVISMTFHEVGGLAVCGLFLIHKILNWDWIAAVTKKLFSKTLPAKTRLGYIVDFLFLAAVILIAVSGMLISKTILTGISSQDMAWKIRHYFASSVALILLGIHIGLHWPFIKGMFAKVIKLPHSVAKPLGILCLAAVIIYGGYNIATSSFNKWLSTPLNMATSSESERPQMPELSEDGESDILLEGDDSEHFETLDGDRESMPEMPVETFNFGQIFNVLATYGSISAVFAFLTRVIEGMIKNKKAKQAI